MSGTGSDQAICKQQQAEGSISRDTKLATGLNQGNSIEHSAWQQHAISTERLIHNMCVCVESLRVTSACYEMRGRHA